MIELKGQQVRIRIQNPSGFTKFGTQDIGKRGKMQRVAGYKDGIWYTQSYRLNLSDYFSVTDVLFDARTIKGISESDLDKIASLTRKYFRSVNG